MSKKNLFFATKAFVVENPVAVGTPVAVVTMNENLSLVEMI
jgi:hypothetical protein